MKLIENFIVRSGNDECEVLRGLEEVYDISGECAMNKGVLAEFIRKNYLHKDIVECREFLKKEGLLK